MLQQSTEEWICGRTHGDAFEVAGSDVMPAILACFEVSSGTLVSLQVRQPEEADDFIALLQQAMQAPNFGPPRRPAQVRVAQQHDAAILRQHYGSELRIVRAPSPELKKLLQTLQGQTIPVARVGPNMHCPCGSGKKYKKCHGAIQLLPSVPETPDESVHDLDRDLTDAIFDFTFDRFGDDFVEREMDRFATQLSQETLGHAWICHHAEVEGRSPAAHYLEAQGRGLAARSRRWLEAQAATWLTLWRVIEVDPGRSLLLQDMLTETTRRVQEAKGAQADLTGRVMLARVVDFSGTTVLCGNHSNVLTGLQGLTVEARLRKRLRKQSRVSAEQLHTVGNGRALIKYWEEEVQETEQARRTGPVLHNTSGDPMLPTVDQFAFSPGVTLAAVRAALSNTPELELDMPNPRAREIKFVRLQALGQTAAGPGQTLLGTVLLTRDGVRAEANSVKRADSLAQIVRRACGNLLKHRGRSHTDPLGPGAPQLEPAGAQALPPGIDTQALTAMLLQAKQSHYATWNDVPLPALAGATPRQAVRSQAGRKKVVALLDEMQAAEDRDNPPGQRFNFADLRRDLALP